MKRSELLIIVCIIIIGVFLRLYQLDKQIIGDDEWHAIYISASKSFKYIISHFHFADNCIPLTIFYWMSLKTIGLNELVLRSLQLITGIGALILFPMIIKSVFNKKVVIIFVSLLAISPLLIYFSRYARPYIIVTFFSFISIFSFYFWIKQRKLHYAVVYVGTGILAPYFSLSSLASVAAPLLYVLFCVITAKTFCGRYYQVNFPPLRQLLIVGAALVSGISLWLFPTINSIHSVTSKISLGSTNFNAIMSFFCLFAGSGNFTISLLMFLCLCYGFYLMFKQDKFLFGYFSVIITLQILSILIVRPHGLQDAIVIARYSIPCLPLWLLLIAVTLNHFSARVNSYLEMKKVRGSNYFSVIIPLSFLLLIFLQGPIIYIYKNPNNFTNHNDYQYDYQHHSYQINQKKLDLFPEFYLELKRDKRDLTIIETPYLMFWPGNNFHIYQRYHGKNVLIGHTDDSFISFKSSYMHKKIRLQNFVNINNQKSLKLSKAVYVVIHKDMLNESVNLRSSYPLEYAYNTRYLLGVKSNRNIKKEHGNPSKKQAKDSIIKLKNIFGIPFYEDKWITVFEINKK